MERRVDHITGGIYRISTWTPSYRITFNQFVIDDERPALIHTGEHGAYESIREAIAEVLDPSRLAYIALLHWEGDENGGMDRFRSGGFRMVKRRISETTSSGSSKRRMCTIGIR